MTLIDILLPAMGEGVIEATITQILRKVGEKVEEDDSIVEIATDKVDSEIPAPEDGVIFEISVEEGEIVKVGQLIAKIKTEAEENSENISLTKDLLIEKNKDFRNKNESIEIRSEEDEDVQKIDTTRFLPPLVKSIILKERISTAVIEQIEGTGLNGRITKNDILKYLDERKMTSESNLIDHKTEEPSSSSENIEDEIIEMDRMRRLISDHMLSSVKTSPHVTSFVEADRPP